MKLEGRIALITGGSSGIGLATARLFIREGARVFITGRNAHALNEAVSLLGHQAIPLCFDVADIGALEASVEQAATMFGGVDVVFANAGASGTTPVGATSLQQFESILRTNLTSVFFLIQALKPHLRLGSSIVLNGSTLATLGQAETAAYAASKGALKSLTRVLASEFAQRGIRVNQVTPGATRTPFWKPIAPTDKEMLALDRRLTTAIPLGRLGEAEEVAKAVLYLGSDDSSNMTGQELVVDGGATGAPWGSAALRSSLLH